MVIEDIRNSIKADMAMEYSAHCLKRMIERGISKRDILNVILTGEIIEDYPLDSDNKVDKSLPSCLILGTGIDADRNIHVVLGYNGRKILIISACYPDREHWNEDDKTRR